MKVFGTIKEADIPKILGVKSMNECRFFWETNMVNSMLQSLNSEIKLTQNPNLLLLV